MARTSFIKPKIVISQCLTNSICRWDGERLIWPFARLLKQYARLIPVCPEMEIGLGCPREKIVIVDRDGTLSLHQPATGRSLTRPMTAFSQRHAAGLSEVDGFFLKSKSPSCGIRDTKRLERPDEQARTVGRGPGFYAAEVLGAFADLPIEDERRLDKHAVREHWLTRLFMLAAFRSLRKRPSPGRLRNFHNRNEQLLRAYSRTRSGKLRRIVDNLLTAPSEAALADYEMELKLALKRPARPSALVAAMVPAFDHYSAHLERTEKQRYRRMARKCAEGAAPANDVRKLIQVWAVRYDKNFTRQQSLYRPYPGPLAASE